MQNKLGHQATLYIPIVSVCIYYYDAFTGETVHATLYFDATAVTVTALTDEQMREDSDGE